MDQWTAGARCLIAPRSARAMWSSTSAARPGICWRTSRGLSDGHAARRRSGRCGTAQGARATYRTPAAACRRLRAAAAGRQRRRGPVSANLLEHVPMIKRRCGEVARVLRPGRRAVVVVPAGPDTYDYYDRFLGHERRYARGELAARVARRASCARGCVPRVGALSGVLAGQAAQPPPATAPARRRRSAARVAADIGGDAATRRVGSLDPRLERPCCAVACASHSVIRDLAVFEACSASSSPPTTRRRTSSARTSGCRQCSMDSARSWELIFSVDPCPDRTEELIMALQMGSTGQDAAFLPAIRTADGDARRDGGGCRRRRRGDRLRPAGSARSSSLRWSRAGERASTSSMPSGRTRAGETLPKRIVPALGYKVIARIAEVEIPRNTGDFRLMSRRVVDNVVALKESHGFLRGSSDSSASGRPASSTTATRAPEGRASTTRSWDRC